MLTCRFRLAVDLRLVAMEDEDFQRCLEVLQELQQEAQERQFCDLSCFAHSGQKFPPQDEETSEIQVSSKGRGLSA